MKDEFCKYCGCEIEDLIVCGEYFGECQPGYKHDITCGDCKQSCEGRSENPNEKCPMIFTKKDLNCHKEVKDEI